MQQSQTSRPVPRAVPKMLGRFQCEEWLGGDGLVETFRARVQGLAGFDRVFAVTCLPAGAPRQRPDAAQRFLEAARRTAAVKDPRIAQVVEANTVDGWVFLATEFIYGVSLTVFRELASAARTDETQGGLPPNWFALLAQMGTEAARGLAAAHAQNPPLVHGGLAPSHIRVTPRGSIKLLDFGLREAVNAPGDIGAQPDLWSYAAPELMLGGDATPAADLFGLGAILFELCVGEPFPSSNADGEATGALEKLSGVPRPLARVVAALLAALPEARPSAVRAAGLLRESTEGASEPDLRAELGSLVQRLSQHEPRTAPAGDAADAVIIPSARRVEPPGRPKDIARTLKPVAIPVRAPLAPNATPDVSDDDDDPGQTRESASPLVGMPAAREWPAVGTDDPHDTSRVSLDGVPMAEMPAFTSMEVAGIFPPEMQSGAMPAVDSNRRKSSTNETPAFQGFLKDGAEEDPETDPQDAARGEQLQTAHDDQQAGHVDKERSRAAQAAFFGGLVLPSTTTLPMQLTVAFQPTGTGGTGPTTQIISPTAKPASGPPTMWVVAGLVVVVVAVAAGLGGYMMGSRAKVQARVAAPKSELAATTAVAAQATPAVAAVVPAIPPPPPPAQAPQAAQPDSVTSPRAGAEAPIPPEPTKAATETINSAGSAPAAPVGINIATTPSGANIWLGGNELGRTPLATTVPAGSGELLIVRAGHRTVKLPIEASEGLRIERKLVAASAPAGGSALVKVLCRTQGKYPIIIDGAETGLLCPVAQIALPPGPHEIAIYIPATDESHRWKLQLRPGPRVVGFKL